MKRAAEGAWVGLFYHDTEHAFGRLSFDGKRLICEAMVGAEVRESK